MKQIVDDSEKLSVLVIEDNQGDFVLIEDYLLDKFKHINIIKTQQRNIFWNLQF